MKKLFINNKTKKIIYGTFINNYSNLEILKLLVILFHRYTFCLNINDLGLDFF